MTAAAAAAAVARALRRSSSAYQLSYISIGERLFSSSTSFTKSKPPSLPGFSHATASLHRFLQVVTPGAVRLNPVRFFARDGSINHNPQRSSFLKHRKGTIKGISGNEICFGKYGLQALESARITSRQIEAGRRAMTQVARRGGGKLWVRIFPYKSVTGKPAEVRMGRGKGNVSYWVAVARPGRILYELGGVAESVARRAIEIAAAKMPIRTRFVIRDKQVKEIGLR